MKYDFTLVLSGISDFSDEQIDALYEAGCDDATVSQRYGRVFITFTRESGSFVDAVASAISDVHKANIGASVQRVDDCNLVTQAEIARRIDRSRQLIRQYISGERGPGSFPPPICNITEGQPLWYWCEVAYWLSENNLIREDENRAAQELAAINSILELQHLKLIAPEVTTSLLERSKLCNPSCDAEIEA